MKHLLTILILLSFISCEAELLEQAQQLQNDEVSRVQEPNNDLCMQEIIKKESDLMKCNVYTTETPLMICGDERLYDLYQDFYNDNICKGI